MTRNLKITAQELQHHLEAIFREFPELDDDEDMKLDTLEGEGFDDILSAVVKKSLEANAIADATKAIRNNLIEREARFRRQNDGWRSVAMRLLQSASLRKHVMPIATVSINKGQQTVILTDDAENLPLEFQRHKIEADKKALLEALKKGVPIDGAVLSNGPPSLTIRSK